MSDLYKQSTLLHSGLFVHYFTVLVSDFISLSYTMASELGLELTEN